MKKILIVLFCLLSIHTYAQEPCATGTIHQELMANDPQYRKAIQAADQGWLDYNRSSKKVIVNNSDTTFEIPVVFHVLHRGVPEGHPDNPTDADIKQMLQDVNDNFAATATGKPDTTNGGVRVPFRFVLAKTAPNCQPTNAILRVDGRSNSSYATKGIEYGGGVTNEADVKGLSVWPHQEYLNIWIVWRIDGTAIGFANPPGTASDKDGVTIEGSFIQSVASVTHEIGHYFGLLHTFEGDVNGSACPANSNCLLEGDRICDTEPHRRSVGPCGNDINPCTNKPSNFVRNNYMSYSGSCRDRFTKGQLERMMYTAYVYRKALLYSPRIDTPQSVTVKPAQCNAICTAPASFSSIGGVSEVEFNTIYNVSGGLKADLYKANPDYTCHLTTEVNAGQTYPMIVKTQKGEQRIAVYIDYNNDGTFQVPNEEVYNNAVTSGQEHNISVTIPLNADTGVMLRMRVISEDEPNIPNVIMSPCMDLSNGQAEDYGVVIRGAASIGNTNTSAMQMKLYPNPANSTVSVSLAISDQYTIHIISTDGRIVTRAELQGASTTLDVSTLPDGVYILKAVGTEHVYTHRFSKQ